jgi:hypothetical protein
MDLPITKPSSVSYAENCDFKEVLNELSMKNHNGFIRITEGNDEGFILFKNGREIAASFERFSRTDAINKIQAAVNHDLTLIEIFNVRESQIDFLMEINQPYVLGSEAYKIIDELKMVDVPEPQPKAVPKPRPVSEAIIEPEKPEKVQVETESSLINSSKPEEEKDTDPKATEHRIETVKSDSPTKLETEDLPLKNTETVEDKTDNETPKPSETIPEPDSKSKIDKSSLQPEINTDTDNSITNENNSAESSPKISSSDDESSELTLEETENNEMPEMESEPLDRIELLKKYGIKDIQEEDVENILESYKGGSVSDEDVEKIELTLMNKIKKSILGIPKIRGAEVMVFLENSRELTGNVNIIIETESKGFLSRIMGDSDNMKLEKQIIDMSQIEIRKSFRKYPEIVEKFEVNVEIS